MIIVGITVVANITISSIMTEIVAPTITPDSPDQRSRNCGDPS